MTWPIVLSHQEIKLRPLRVSDSRTWSVVRRRNQAWLSPWEATSPYPTSDPAPTFRQSTRRMLRDARAGRAMPFVIEYQGNFVGQINVSDMTQGSLWSCHVGYWIDESVSNHGIMTTSVALVVDHLLLKAKVHRVEIAVRPENVPSNKLVQRLGFRFEGIRQNFLHIDGAWRNHNVYVMLREDLSAPLVEKFQL